jgi:F0F1-type ATP synthase assembly protein I
MAKKSKKIANITFSSALREASSLSFALVLYPIIFLLLGVYADKKLHTTPLFIILGFFAGLVWFAWRAYKLANKLKKEK